MKLKKEGLATLGLIFITVLAAFQYGFLRNVPDTVSSFAFVCVTNAIGVLILAAAQPKKLVKIRKSSVKKGAFFAVELLGFNVFLLLGSRHLDAVIISSLVSMYFVFVTPLLLLLKKKVSFFSGIATVIAVISLLLLFGADTEALLSSPDAFYLILADMFFAAYVVSVSLFGEGEDATQLTFFQMLFAGLFGLAGWCLECLILGKSFALPVEWRFWVSALFIGVFIRVVYGVVQISAQKYVSALKTSLIFSAEIIITLLTNPLLCKLLHTDYTPITIFQVLGGQLLILATLMVDDTVMARFGYDALKETTYVNNAGETAKRGSVAKKVIMTNLTFSMVTLVLSAVTFLSAIYLIRTDAVANSQTLGETASSVSAEAMMNMLEESIQSQATDKSLLAEQKLSAYSKAVSYAASYVHSLLLEPESYPDKEVEVPRVENGGIWAMQRQLANESFSYEEIRPLSRLLGNVEDVFAPIVQNNDNIATIYMATEAGLLIGYDPYSDTAAAEDQGESYYNFLTSTWYLRAKNARNDTPFFTETYQDGYGRGLTISCVAPFTDANGHYAGCVAMDILVAELNASMVNDGIVEPSVAVLVDQEGNYLAGKDVDPLAENMGSIFDPAEEESLRTAAAEILEKKDGIARIGEGENADYIAYATIKSTNWTLCINSPVSSVIAPAVAIRENINENTRNVVNTVMQGIMTVIQSCLLFTALILIFVTLFAGRFSRRISDPLNQLEADVQQISEGNLDNRTQVETDDEIGSLANSFNKMAESLQKYIADLQDVTAKEQRVAGELNAATNIQASMLPRHFPPFPDRTEFDLYATMTPAKEVGGDFYDYFMIDNDHLALVMADVSGKGVPAALFMAISKTMLKSRTLAGGSPAEIMRDVNSQLCEGNDEELFVTVWLGILTISTGHLVSASAGHEYPAFYRRESGRFDLEKDKHGMPLATMEGLRFRETETDLKPGDALFVYTDGVTEATSGALELFGEVRMIEALNHHGAEKPDDILKGVRGEIDAFVGDAPQFDDITMLCLRYH